MQDMLILSGSFNFPLPAGIDVSTISSIEVFSNLRSRQWPAAQFVWTLHNFATGLVCVFLISLLVDASVRTKHYPLVQEACQEFGKPLTLVLHLIVFRYERYLVSLCDVLVCR